MFCVSGKGSSISCDMFPPVELGNSENWEIGLVNLCTYNSIPNVETNYNDVITFNGRKITIPEGSYEISDIANFLKTKLLSGEELNLTANNNTLKCEIRANHVVDLTDNNSIGKMLGFEKTILKENITHQSLNPVDIIRVNSIRVDCNIARGSYVNGFEKHTLHEFFPSVPPGFKIVEAPPTVIYVPVNTNRIHNISVQLTDQDGRLINFRGETVTVRLHLRRQRTT